MPVLNYLQSAAPLRIFVTLFHLQNKCSMEPALISNTRNVAKCFGLSACAEASFSLLILRPSITCWRTKVNKLSENTHRFNKALNVTQGCLILFKTNLFSPWLFYDGCLLPGRERRIKSRDLFFICHIRVDRKRRQVSVSRLTAMISVCHRRTSSDSEVEPCEWCKSKNKCSRVALKRRASVTHESRHFHKGIMWS